MKRIPILLVLIVIVSLAACTQDDKSKSQEINPIDTVQGFATNDSTIYGRYVEGGMSALSIVTDSGDTLTFVLETADTVTVVQGGMFDGDKMAIIAEKTADGDMFASKVINITSLIGKWTNIAKNFEIEDGGVVVSSMQTETNPYTTWKIYNGKLLLNTDTFDVYRLGPDSLSLENATGIFDYKRVK